MDFYRVLWHDICRVGRPFTYVMREWSQQHPILMRLLSYSILLSLVLGQILLSWHFGLWAIPFVLAADGVFILTGHTVWDTVGEYILHDDDFR